MFSLEDYEKHAGENLPKSFWDALRKGADKDETLEHNVEDFKKIRIIPRYFRDLSQVTTETELFGKPFSMPIGIAPSSAHKQYHPDGELATVKAAAACKTIMIVSIGSSIALEEIAAAAPSGENWMQLTLMNDEQVNFDLMKRAEDSGYNAIVLTADMPIKPLRYHLLKTSQHSYFEAMNLSKYENLKSDPWFDCAKVRWEHVKDFIEKSKLPVIIKGILSAEDALIAMDIGAKGIIVSNHGGRQLDGAISTIEALATIVQDLKNIPGIEHFSIFMDGGIRGGVDAFRALSLGAKFVFVGRPSLHGLFHSGQNGVEQVLKILQSELQTVMAQAGCVSVASISSEYVKFKF